MSLCSRHGPVPDVRGCLSFVAVGLCPSFDKFSLVESKGDLLGNGVCCCVLFPLLNFFHSSPFFLQVRKFRTLTELILDAQEHVKNPYKGKKLKVSFQEEEHRG